MLFGEEMLNALIGFRFQSSKVRGLLWCNCAFLKKHMPAYLCCMDVNF